MHEITRLSEMKRRWEDVVFIIINDNVEDDDDNNHNNNRKIIAIINEKYQHQMISIC
jgi:hypothetical protein